MSRDVFAGCHPAINFGYLAAVILLGLTVQHPAYGLVSLAGALSYALFLGRRGALGYTLAFALPMVALTALLNPLFVHQGVTILFYFRDNPVTLEAAVYGLTRGVMFGSALLWFYCYGRLITGDKFMHLFGGILPSGSLIFSMVLGFIPRFTKRMARISEAQKFLAPRWESAGIRSGIRRGVKILGTMTTWSLENAVDTSDSMRSRGYGLPGRSRYMAYRPDRRDLLAGILLTGALAAALAGIARGTAEFSAYPFLYIAPVETAGLLSLTGYAALCFAPVLMNLSEAFTWKHIRSAT